MMGKWLAGLMMPIMLATLPASSNFQLNSYGFGAGGAANSSSTNYRANGLTGEVAGSATSTNYKAGTGENYLKQAQVPTVALANNASWYNKLLLTIGPGTNPSDAKFAVAISSDNFTTTQYVKNDFTVSNTLAFADYQTYAAWGSGSGVFVRGLIPSTVYTVKAKAFHGSFTESAYGPTATAATVEPQMTFDIDVAPTDISTSPPYKVAFGDLLAGSVIDATDKIWVSFDTNAESGGTIYASGQNAGLHSTTTTYTIASQTGDISTLAEGFGIQGQSATQASGGPFSLLSPYNGSGQNVGVTDAVIRSVFKAPAPVSAARGSLELKAKTKVSTASASDYTEVLTVIAAGSF